MRAVLRSWSPQALAASLLLAHLLGLHRSANDNADGSSGPPEPMRRNRRGKQLRHGDAEGPRDGVQGPDGGVGARLDPSQVAGVQTDPLGECFLSNPLGVPEFDDA